MSDEAIERLEKRIAELEKKLEEPKPRPQVEMKRFDPTERLRLPQSAVKEMAGVVSPSDLEDIRRLRDPSLPQVAGKSGGAVPNWVEPAPLTSDPLARWKKR